MSIVDRGIIARVKKPRPTSLLIIRVHFSMRQIYLTVLNACFIVDCDELTTTTTTAKTKKATSTSSNTQSIHIGCAEE